MAKPTFAHPAFNWPKKIGLLMHFCFKVRTQSKVDARSNEKKG